MAGGEVGPCGAAGVGAAEHGAAARSVMPYAEGEWMLCGYGAGGQDAGARWSGYVKGVHARAEAGAQPVKLPAAALELTTVGAKLVSPSDPGAVV